MELRDFGELINRAAMGYAYHEVVLDDSGKVYDYRFVEANAEFGRLTGLDPQAIIGKTVREVLPGVERDAVDWIGKYGELALKGGATEFEGKSTPLGKWYLVKAVSLNRGFFFTIVLDISYYKKIEADLSRNEERLRLLLENSNDWVIILDKKFNIVYSTRLGTGILGMELDQMSSLDVFSVIHPDDLLKTHETIAWLSANPNKLAVLELRVRHSDGRYLWLEIFASNLLGSPAINGYVINARNITDRINADRALRDSELHLRHITDNITDVVFVTDKELNTIYVSPSVQQMLGESPEKHISKSLPEKHPPQSVTVMMNYFAEEMAREKDPNADPNRTRVIEVQHYKSDGSIIDVSMHISMIRDDKGAFNGLQGVTRDVSFQKRVERELKDKNSYIESLLGAIPDPIFVLNRSGKITDLKVGNFEGLYVPEAQIPNRYLSDIMPPDLTKAVLNRIEQVLQERKTLAFQYRLETQGMMRDYEARLSPLDENHVISLIRDITEQRNAIASIQQQTRFQKMVADVSTAFVKSQVSNIDAILDKSLKKVGEFFGVQRAYIYRYSSDYARLTITNEWHCPNCEMIPQKQSTYLTSTLPW
jgi:PAS domain S-box-containing protein